MRVLSTILAVLLLTNCNLTENKSTPPSVKDSSHIQADTLNANTNKIEDAVGTSAFDSLANAFVDTTTLKGKRQWIMNHFLIENNLSLPDYDTLFDLTYDGYNDYVIGYYGQAGTGIKNRVKVYFYNPKNKRYILDEQLSDLPNPTFYIKQKKITGFYIGNGGGGGGRLEWLNGKWTTTKEFDVHNEGDTTKWKISYPLKKKKEVLVQPYQMIPPENILETKVSIY